ncbi:hypothetical protein AB0M47_26045 [Hamadaea sp. NPDC051192]|uniref:hypothetical protein n=1 Tax=Hamadaea sp. NPDC051192 TaxID=3154940 RepID=UPI003449840D
MSYGDVSKDQRQRRPRWATRWLTATGTVHIPFPRQRPDLEAIETDEAVEVKPPSLPTTVPSRRLCSLSYIAPELRSEIAEHFPAHRRAAWAPCYAVDIAAVLRHAKRARRSDQRRDFLLSILELTTLAAATYLSLGLKVTSFAVVATTAILAGTTRVLMLRNEISIRSLMLRLWRFARRNTGQFMRRFLMILGGAIITTAVAFNHRGTAQSAVVLGLGLVLTWLVIIVTAAVSYVRACGVLTAEDDLADMVKKEEKPVERRAWEISTGNVLVYARDRAEGPLGPFVGAGHELGRWTTPSVKVTKAKDKDVKPGAFDVVELHKRLHRAAGLEIPGLEGQHRLYVDGRSLISDPDLRERRTGPPVTAVAEELILERIRDPRKYQRGYLCLKATQLDGDVVVTLFVRAMLEHDLLQLEVAIYALPPVTWPREEKDASTIQIPRAGRDPLMPRRPLTPVPSRKPLAAWAGIRSGTRSYWSVALGAIPRAAAVMFAPLAERVTRLADRRAIAHDQFDFGAQTSLREHLALDQRLHYNTFVDMMAQAERLQRRLVDAVVEYLTELGIDPDDFARSSATIIQNFQQNIINNLTSGAVTFGNNSSATGTAPGSPPPPHSGTPNNQETS